MRLLRNSRRASSLQRMSSRFCASGDLVSCTRTPDAPGMVGWWIVFLLAAQDVEMRARAPVRGWQFDRHQYNGFCEWTAVRSNTPNDS